MCMTAEEMKKIHEEMLERQRLGDGKTMPPRSEVFGKITCHRRFV